MITSAELEILRTDIPPLVRNFKHSSPNNWGWSCLICGDSKRDKRKARFGVSKVKNELLCNCFNCGWSGTFKTYLQYQHPDLARRVTREHFKENKPLNEETINDRIIKEVDSEILIQIYYINKEPNIKNWLNLLLKKKIHIKNSENQKKLVSLHKRYYNG